MSWPLLKKIASLRTTPRRSERHQRDPRVLSHRGIVWCRTLHPDLHREMPQWAGLSLGRLSSKEDSDLQCLSSSNNSFAQGRMPHSSIVGMTTIGAITAAVLITLPRIARDPRGLIQGKTPTRTTTRARARGKCCKFGKGELTSLLLQGFPKDHQSCRVLSLSTINYLILVQLIVL